jgi:hypothetical protein
MNMKQLWSDMKRGKPNPSGMINLLADKMFKN